LIRARTTTLLLLLAGGCFAPEAPPDDTRGKRAMAEVSLAGTIAHPQKRARLWLSDAPCDSTPARVLAALHFSSASPVDRFTLDAFVPAGGRAWLCCDAPTKLPLPSPSAPFTKSDLALELR
jgi:hypothetical protein